MVSRWTCFAGSAHRCTVSLALAAAILVAGCTDADPVGLAYRRIAGEYELYESEMGDYYLTRDRHNFEVDVRTGCTVEELGWTEKHIFVKRSPQGGKDPDRWMIIYLRTNVMIGPLSDAEFRRRFPRAVVSPAGEAWVRL